MRPWKISKQLAQKSIEVLKNVKEYKIPTQNFFGRNVLGLQDKGLVCKWIKVANLLTRITNVAIFQNSLKHGNMILCCPQCATAKLLTN